MRNNGVTHSEQKQNTFDILLTEQVVRGPQRSTFVGALNRTAIYVQCNYCRCTVLGARIKPVVISGGCRGGAQEARVPPPLFWIKKKKKESQKEEKLTGQATKNRSPP